MGFLRPEMPRVGADWYQQSRAERIKPMARHIAERGMGNPEIFYLLSGADMIVAAKCVMLAIWIGAATSKLNRHFPFVVATMMSNNPLIRPKWLKRNFFRHFPDDLLPGWLPRLLAHGGTGSGYRSFCSFPAAVLSPRSPRR